MSEVYIFLLENQETIMKDMAEDITTRMRYAGMFKGSTQDLYIDNINKMIRSAIIQTIEKHFSNLNGEEILMTLEDERVTQYINDIQNYFTKETYRVNKNSLH